MLQICASALPILQVLVVKFRFVLVLLPTRLVFAPIAMDRVFCQTIANVSMVTLAAIAPFLRVLEKPQMTLLFAHLETDLVYVAIFVNVTAIIKDKLVKFPFVMAFPPLTPMLAVEMARVSRKIFASAIVDTPAPCVMFPFAMACQQLTRKYVVEAVLDVLRPICVNAATVLLANCVMCPFAIYMLLQIHLFALETDRVLQQTIAPATCTILARNAKHPFASLLKQYKAMFAPERDAVSRQMFANVLTTMVLNVSITIASMFTLPTPLYAQAMAFAHHPTIAPVPMALPVHNVIWQFAMAKRIATARFARLTEFAVHHKFALVQLDGLAVIAAFLFALTRLHPLHATMACVFCQINADA